MWFLRVYEAEQDNIQCTCLLVPWGCCHYWFLDKVVVVNSGFVYYIQMEWMFRVSTAILSERKCINNPLLTEIPYHFKSLKTQFVHTFACQVLLKGWSQIGLIWSTYWYWQFRWTIRKYFTYFLWLTDWVKIVNLLLYMDNKTLKT